MTGPETTTEAALRKDKVTGLLIVALSFVGCLGLSLWAKKASGPELWEQPPPPLTEDIEGWPGAVDPVQLLPTARELTPRVVLRGIVAEGVGASGALDMDKPLSRIRYVFQSPKGQGPQPPHPPGEMTERKYCGKQTIHVRSVGMVADPDRPSHPCPQVPEEPLPDPMCGPKEVWQYAIEHKQAPAERLARIEYYRAKGGPAWRFMLPGSGIRFSLYGDCERELTGRDAVGSVP